MMSEAPSVLLKRWAAGTDFVLDAEKAPKAEFARLALAKGWAGGDEEWRSRWEQCFGEVYGYGGEGRDKTTAASPGKQNPRQKKFKKKNLRTTDLVDRMDRLPVGSDTSGFTVVSAAPSVRSLDSNGSVTGGVDVSSGHESAKQYGNQQPAPASNDSTNAPIFETNLPDRTRQPKTKSKKKTKKNKSPTPPLTLPDRTRNPPTPTSPDPAPRSPACSPFWLQFPSFTPRPLAPFKEEFARLGQQVGLNTTTKKGLLVDALNAEVAFHYGTCLHKLDRWRELCGDVGVGGEEGEGLESIGKCKKELKAVRVNLFNLIDHRRNPDTKIKKFDTHKAFEKSVRENRFPRQCAKQDGFIRVLLKKL